MIDVDKFYICRNSLGRSMKQCESVWVIEAKVVVKDRKRNEEVIQELLSKGFSVKSRNLFFEH